MAAIDTNDWWGSEAITAYFATKNPNELLVQWLNEGILPKPNSVIDMGCGYGRNLTLFTEATFAAAFDPSSGSVLFTMQRSDTPKKLSIIPGSLPDHPFAGECFDLAIADGVLHQLISEESWNLSLVAICKAVMPDGWLFLSSFVSDIDPGGYHSSDGLLWTAKDYPPMRLYRSAEVIARLVASGFAVVRSVVEQFDLSSGSRTNLTILSRFI
ncbi:hypothetical protein FACS1894158_02550 [Betaproteobacteria bacterium]|nr:hypothetical protein FACS1894158_02550 [Betaproteobacteria bacterium]